ncbi:Sulfotransferase family protein [Enhydrobacter aerosaccus]|uniref:Sulfotransferase family protein n=1 Tax=Enhydrobacter aerosaccus TaxID=225324 RepID=A0A1T4SD32_9HYPH|nr:sulfotransferase [Enhydrobacter aerosaccus]SKA26046.1 Sulfotransferase family protein [Enhydrobacter aerosaccus]
MIFLIGTQKSGTTWLRNCFSHVCTVPLQQELYFVELYEHISQHIHTYGHLGEEETLEAIRRVSASSWRSLLDCVKPGTEFDKSAYPCATAHAPIRNDLHPYAVRRAKEVFPDARTVVIVRDPRAVYSSLVEYLNGFQSGWGQKIDPVEFGQTWQLQNTIWLNDRPSIYVRYEDLKKDFVNSLSRIFVACDLVYPQGTLAKITEEEYKIDVGRARQPEIYRLGRVDDFKVRVAPSVIKQIETAAENLMSFLGYRPVGT